MKAGRSRRCWNVIQVARGEKQFVPAAGPWQKRTKSKLNGALKKSAISPSNFLNFRIGTGCCCGELLPRFLFSPPSSGRHTFPIINPNLLRVSSFRGQSVLPSAFMPFADDAERRDKKKGKSEWLRSYDYDLPRFLDRKAAIRRAVSREKARSFRSSIRCLHFSVPSVVSRR